MSSCSCRLVCWKKACHEPQMEKINLLKVTESVDGGCFSRVCVVLEMLVCCTVSVTMVTGSFKFVWHFLS